MARASQNLELTVSELCCADEARQIESALGRLDGVRDVRALVGSRTTLVAYDETRIGPEAIRGAVQGLGMTVAETKAPSGERRRPLADRLGWAFVSAVALVALLGIVAERLGLVDSATERLRGWLSVAAVGDQPELDGRTPAIAVDSSAGPDHLSAARAARRSGAHRRMVVSWSAGKRVAE